MQHRHQMEALLLPAIVGRAKKVYHMGETDEDPSLWKGLCHE